MRKLMLAGGLLTAVIFAGGPALAHGPSGSHEHSGTTYTNNVTCARGTRTPAGVVYAGTNGAEVCNDRGVVPVQGRVIVARSGYIAADGDRNNPGQAKGWARIDQRGVRCGDTGGRQDATHPDSRDTSADCG